MLAAAALAAMPKILSAQVTPAVEARDDAASRDVKEQEAILTDPAAAPAKREEAARRLVSRSSPEADSVLMRVLTEIGNRDSQIAVARALASDPTPQAMFIKPLAERLGSGAILTEAVAQALVTFKGNDDVRQTLVNYATNPINSLEARAGILSAMGKLVDKQAAGSLINIINTDENVRIRDAACDALAEMTGLPRSSDVQGWNQWWEQNRNKSEEQWSKDLLRFNAAARTELSKRLEKMRDDASQRLLNAYRAATTDADKTNLLSTYLQNDSEDVRLLGVQLVRFEAANFRAVPPAVFEQLRKMVGDSASDVRREVATTLGTAGVGAVDALLTQLAQERDSRVRDAIVRALGPSHDLRAVDPLLNALNDANFKVARSAADSLNDLASDLRDPKNAAAAAKVADALNKKLEATPPGPDNKELRTGLVLATASLGHPSSREILQRLAGRAEPLERVRQLALRGLGLIGNPASMLFITSALEDPSKLVQVEACKAMRTCADNFGGVANTLRPRIGKDEPDPDVRAAAWDTLSALFKIAGPEELRQWNQYLNKDPDFSRRLRVQEELEVRYADAKAEDRLAAIRQDIGMQYLLLNQPDKAVEKTQQALDYFQSRNAVESIISPVVNQLMEAKLRTKKYAEAVDFAIDRIGRDPTVLTDMFKKMRDQIDRLKAANDFTGALELITQFKRIELKQYGPLVTQIENEIKQLQSTGGRVYVRQPKAYEHVARFQFHVL
ncbi:MAG TPA: HEAT repeat domain-containing protein [Tepidisphaeraceae bacterium]|nr:HEAT repeat domain-containing protein [Tepidisphaeraceae bacterium]